MIFSWIVILLFIEQLMVYFEGNKAVIRGKIKRGKPLIIVTYRNKKIKTAISREPISPPIAEKLLSHPSSPFTQIEVGFLH